MAFKKEDLFCSLIIGIPLGFLGALATAYLLAWPTLLIVAILHPVIVLVFPWFDSIDPFTCFSLYYLVHASIISLFCVLYFYEGFKEDPILGGTQ